jgi:hypothetical protein
MPSVPKFLKILGPSFIILGLGLGSGEVILWPYLTSNYGLGIIWGAVIGITMQFFINMEIERYALVYGESIFVGFARKLRFLPIWFIVSSFLGFGWPGIGLSAATLLSNALGIDNVRLTGVFIFVGIGLLLSVGKVLYKTVETLQKVLILIGVPFIVFLVLYFVEASHVQALFAGIVGRGEGFRWLPEGIALQSFLAALVYSGAGGNLNLSQSFYVRDKGYGMGAYASSIKSIFTAGKSSDIQLSGSTFETTEANLKRFRGWWKIVNLEHLIVFWGLGLFTILMLALLSYSTVYGKHENFQGINFVLNESTVIAKAAGGIVATLFLLIAGAMLSATQLTVLESTSRIITENFLLATGKAKANVSKIFYTVLWAQILFGITVFLVGFDEPRALLQLGALVNAVAMVIYTALILYLNNRVIHKEVRPSIIRNILLSLIFIFLLGFSLVTFKSWL